MAIKEGGAGRKTFQVCNYVFLFLLMIEFVLAREPWTHRKTGGKKRKEAAA